MTFHGLLLSCPDSARRKLQHREGCCRRNAPHLILFYFILFYRPPLSNMSGRCKMQRCLVRT